MNETRPRRPRDLQDPVASTALWTGAERARESARPDRLFDDPLAECLAGPEGVRETRAVPASRAEPGESAGDLVACAAERRVGDDVTAMVVDVR